MRQFFLFLFIISSSISFSQSFNMNVGTVNAKNYYEEIPFEFVKDKIIIPVEIKGHTYQFMLDTGAPNLISKELYNTLQPKHLKSIPIKDANDNVDTLQVVSIRSLKLGNTEFNDTATLVHDLNGSEVFKCFKVDGFIGSNMLRKSIIQIDLENKVLRLTDKKKKLTLNKKNSVKMKLLGVQSSPYIWVNLKGKNNPGVGEQLLIDTGMDGLYDLSFRHYNLFKEKDVFIPVASSEGASSFGLFGSANITTNHRLHLPTFKLVNFELDDCIVTTTEDDNSRIGSGFLKYGVMTVDFKNKRFYFEPKKQRDTVTEKLFDISPTINGEKVVIGFVWNDDLKDTIKYGDEIIEVNGQTLDKSRICDLVSGSLNFDNVDTLNLKLKSADSGDIFEITVHKKNPLSSN